MYFYRTKEGKKGIGRFAAQSLGERLILVTQTKESTNAIQIEIDWDKYSIDKDITTITFPIRNIPKEKVEGTTIKIHVPQKWLMIYQILIFDHLKTNASLH